MITINGKRFAENEAEMVESLFHAGGTCVGYAKRLKRRVSLYNQHHKLIGCINKHGCLCKANIQDDGAVWWNFGTIDEIGEVGVSEVDRAAQLAMVYREWNGAFTELIYRFK